MKINVFRTQLKIGSPVKYKGVEYKVQDFDRTSNEINLSRNKGGFYQFHFLFLA